MKGVKILICPDGIIGEKKNLGITYFGRESDVIGFIRNLLMIIIFLLKKLELGFGIFILGFQLMITNITLRTSLMAQGPS